MAPDNSRPDYVFSTKPNLKTIVIGPNPKQGEFREDFQCCTHISSTNSLLAP
jgi:hypothetical protein